MVGQQFLVWRFLSKKSMQREITPKISQNKAITATILSEGCQITKGWIKMRNFNAKTTDTTV